MQETLSRVLRPEVSAPVVVRTDEPGFLPFAHIGNLTVRQGTSRLPIKGGTFRLHSVAAMLDTPATGSAVVLDVNKNGSSIFTNQANRPTIAAGSHVATVGDHVSTLLTDGDYLTVDIDQIGSDDAGADLVVSIRLRSV